MKPTNQVFGNKVRVRACGLCYNNDAILLVKHNIDGQILWAPPGGGVEFGETTKNTLIREFKEECSLDIKPGRLVFMTEFIKKPLHAIELFYQINSYSGDLKLGTDPEVAQEPILLDIGFFNDNKIKQLPRDHLHPIFKNCTNPIQLLDKQGHLIY